jgi:hypothetical protein
VIRSTGWEPHRPRQVQITGAAEEAVKRSLPHYQRLHEVRLRL